MSRSFEAQATADQILTLERNALDRWGSGDPGGFLDLYAADVSYFDPGTAVRIDGHPAMATYYAPWVGKIQIVRYDMLSPHVVVEGNMALLTYNLVNYIRDAHGAEVIGSQWNSTVVYRRLGDSWKTVHSHWSFTRHPALQNETPESSEGLGVSVED
jgi:ketosteroid isomerase-like protein